MKLLLPKWQAIPNGFTSSGVQGREHTLHSAIKIEPLYWRLASIGASDYSFLSSSSLESSEASSCLSTVCLHIIREVSLSPILSTNSPNIESSASYSNRSYLRRFASSSLGGMPANMRPSTPMEKSFKNKGISRYPIGTIVRFPLLDLLILLWRS